MIYANVYRPVSRNVRNLRKAACPRQSHQNHFCWYIFTIKMIKRITSIQEPLRALTTAETRLKYSTATGEEVICIAAHQWSWHRRQ